MGAGEVMADKYCCYQELAANHREGIDFTICATSRTDSFLCVVAPHAGKIEFQTGELAHEIANDQHSCYVFEGKMAKDNHTDLHITSRHCCITRA